MENLSTEVSLESHLILVKEESDHPPVVLFTKYSMDAHKNVIVVNLLPTSFVGGTKIQGITCIIKGSWDPERLVEFIYTVGVPVEEALSDIGTNVMNVAIHMECGDQSSWLRSLV